MIVVSTYVVRQMSLQVAAEKQARLWDTLEVSHAVSSRNLGEGEQPWEAANGPILNRLAGCGNEGIRFIRSLGIKPSVARELINRVGHVGRQSLRLIADRQLAQTCFRATVQQHKGAESVRTAGSQLDSIPEDLFQRVSLCVNQSGNLLHRCRHSLTSAVYNQASKLRLRADWDTRSYGKADLLSACNLLVEEVMTSNLCEKTVVALRMLDILCRR